ncbi:MAG TPA: hypothetical protein VGG34_12670 [Opitutaceae bacterium]|jgi:hypothetical protein
MSQPDADLQKRAAALEAELSALAKREASYRAKMVQEFADRGERNTYMHSLREEIAALVKRGQEASSDIEVLTRKLEAELARSAALSAELDAVKRSLSWRVTAPLRRFASDIQATPRPAAARLIEHSPADGAPFTYYLHTSPFRIYRGSTFTLRGWAWPEDGRSVTAVRANIDGRLFPGRHGIDEAEVLARYGPQPANSSPGFEITFETPEGRHVLGIEAQLSASEWRTVMRTTIWCEPDGRA